MDQTLTNSTSLGFYYLGIAVAFLLTSSVVGGIILLVLNRYFKKRDDNASVHETNQTATLEAGTKWGELLLQRVESLEAESKIDRKEFERKLEDQKLIFENKLETQKLNLEQKIDNLQGIINSQMIEAGRKDEKILNWEKENTRLRARIKEQDATIAELRRELDTLKLLVDKNGPHNTTEDPLHVKIVEPEPADHATDSKKAPRQQGK